MISEHGSVLVVGPAGIGKTFFVQRLLAGVPHAVGQCLPAFASTTYRPLNHALRRNLSGTPTEVATDVAASLRGTLLLLEDVHWADAGTLEVMSHLVGRVEVVLTARPGERVSTLRAAYRVLEVEPLSPRSAAALARQLHRDLDEAEHARLVEAAGGNPLLLRELVTGASASPTLAQAIADRVQRLPDALIDGLGRLALQGCPTSSELLGLDHSALAGLVSTDADGTAWFTHEQVAAEVLALLDEPTRKRLRADLVDRVSERDRARHLRALGRPADAAESAVRAAADANTAERADLLTIAVDCLGDGAPASLRLAAARALVGAHRAAAVRSVLAGLDGPDDVLAEVGLLRAKAAWLDGDADGALLEVEDSLALLPRTPSPLRAELVVERAAILVRTRVGDPSLASMAAEAHDAAEEAGVLQARAESLAGLALSHSGQAGWAQRFTSAAERARAEGDVEEECAAAYWLVSAYGFYGPIQKAILHGAPMLERTQRLGMHRWAHHFLGAHVIHRVVAGEWDDALLAAAADLLVHEPRFRNRALVELALVMAAVDREDVAAARNILSEARRFARTAEDQALLAGAALDVAAATGDAEDACRLLSDLASRGVGYFGFNAGAESFAMSACIASARREDLPRFDSSLSPALDVAGIERVGYDAWREGADGDAIDAYLRAEQAWEDRGFRRFARRARFAAIDVALGGGQIERARALLDESGQLAPVSGSWVSGWTFQRRERLSRAAAAQMLTAREVEVLKLVAHGRSSANIADALQISETTVNSHVNSALRKLGCRTRRQAAAMVGT